MREKYNYNFYRLWSERHVTVDQRLERYHIDGFEDGGRQPQAQEGMKRPDTGKARELIV